MIKTPVKHWSIDWFITGAERIGEGLYYGLYYIGIFGFAVVGFTFGWSFGFDEWGVVGGTIFGALGAIFTTIGGSFTVPVLLVCLAVVLPISAVVVLVVLLIQLIAKLVTV